MHGAQCHRSKVACEFLRKRKIQVLEWPGNSTDPNPIENLWNTLKNKVTDKQPSSMEHLWQVINETRVKIRCMNIALHCWTVYCDATKLSLTPVKDTPSAEIFALLIIFYI